MADQISWQDILGVADELSRSFPSLILIGGVAVYLHTINKPSSWQPANLAEFSHDVDACISLADFGDLRDMHAVTPNTRLSKQQIDIRGIEVDLYVERAHRLAIPYSEMTASAEVFDGLKAAAPEHLLILKLDAAIDRWRSGKGAKDMRDIARILLVIGGGGSTSTSSSLLAGRLSGERMEMLSCAVRSDAIEELAGGNAFHARKLREECTAALGKIKRLAMMDGGPAP